MCMKSGSGSRLRAALTASICMKYLLNCVGCPRLCTQVSRMHARLDNHAGLASSGTKNKTTRDPPFHHSRHHWRIVSCCITTATRPLQHHGITTDTASTTTTTTITLPTLLILPARATVQTPLCADPLGSRSTTPHNGLPRRPSVARQQHHQRL